MGKCSWQSMDLGWFIGLTFEGVETVLHVGYLTPHLHCVWLPHKHLITVRLWLNSPWKWNVLKLLDVGSPNTYKIQTYKQTIKNEQTNQSNETNAQRYGRLAGRQTDIQYLFAYLLAYLQYLHAYIQADRRKYAEVALLDVPAQTHTHLVTHTYPYGGFSR